MNKPLLLDANLAVLLVVGATDVRYIKSHKRLDNFDEIDFHLLSDVISKSSAVFFTPNVLSETSNLARNIGEPMRSQITNALGVIISRAEERYIESVSAIKRSEYIKLGLTDAALLRAAETGAVLLTVDLDLYVAALAAELDAINFTHLRDTRPDFAQR